MSVFINHPGHVNGMCLISHQYKFIYFNIPRCASRSFKIFLATNYNTQVANYHSLNPQIKAQYFTFAFIRNPFKRFLSIFYVLNQKGRPTTRSKPFWQVTCRLRKFNQFLIDLQTNGFWDEHLIPMHSFLYHHQTKQAFKIDYLGRLESLDQDWFKICQLNQMKYIKMNQRKHIQTNPDWMINLDELTDQQRETIKQIYQGDFDQIVPH